MGTHYFRSGMSRRFVWHIVAFLAVITALLPASAAPPSPPSPPAPAAFAKIEPASTTDGYLARLLINETPFPGERAYSSEADTRMGMVQIVWVLDGRRHVVPKGYTQWQLAGVRSDNIIDIITGAPGRPQCEGFTRDSAGRPVTARRVEDRLTYLLNIANKGSGPGRFANLINYAQGLASAYNEGGIETADHFAGLRSVGKTPVTGRAYSWMTNVNNYNPGGNFVRIPDSEDGSLGGNRYFTLRKDPK